jgi:hypothetical protein
VGEDQLASKSFFEAAYSAYDNCVKEADEEFYDTFLQEIKTEYCTPYSQEVQKVLETL